MYAIDRIENDKVIVENLDTKEKLEMFRNSLPFPVHEGLIFSKQYDIYILEKEREKERRKSLRERLENLKKHE